MMNIPLNCISIVLQRMQKALECAICMDLMVNPSTTKCGHSFCASCLDTMLAEAKSSIKCPLCMTSVTKRSLTQNGKIRGLVHGVQGIIQSIKQDCGVKGLDVNKAEASVVQDTFNSNEAKQDTEICPRRSTRKKDTPVLHVTKSDDNGAVANAPKKEVKKDTIGNKTLKKKNTLKKDETVNKVDVSSTSVVDNVKGLELVNRSTCVDPLPVEEKVTEWLQQSSDEPVPVIRPIIPVDACSQQSTVAFSATQNPLDEEKPDKKDKTDDAVEKVTILPNFIKPKSIKKLAKNKTLSKSTSNLVRNQSKSTMAIANSTSDIDETKISGKRNLRFASEIKTKLLDQVKVNPVSMRSKNTKSPGWSHIEGSKKDLKSKMKSLNITGGEEKVGNLSKSMVHLRPVPSPESLFVIEDPSQTADKLESMCEDNNDPVNNELPVHQGLNVPNVEVISPKQTSIQNPINSFVDSVPKIKLNDDSIEKNHCNGVHTVPCEVFMWLKQFFNNSSCILEKSSNALPRSPINACNEHNTVSTDSSVIVESPKDQPMKAKIPDVSPLNPEECVAKLQQFKSVRVANTIITPNTKKNTSPPNPIKRKRSPPVEKEPWSFSVEKVQSPKAKKASEKRKGSQKSKNNKRFKRIQNVSSDEEYSNKPEPGFEIDSEELRDYERLDENVITCFKQDEKDDMSVSSDSEIPGTEELLSKINEKSLLSKVNYANSESSNCSGMGYLSESTQCLLAHGNKSIQLANQIFDQQEKIPEVPKNKSEITNMSMVSTQSAVITTQKRQVVHHEVENLRSKITKLETELEKKKEVFPVKESDNDSEDLFKSLPSPTKRKETSQRVTRKAASAKTIVCTGLSPSDVTIVKEFVLNACTNSSQVVAAWAQGVTHVIVKTDERNTTERTLKYLYGIASGCWIVSMKWVHDSLKQKTPLPEIDYEVLDCTGVAGPERARLATSPVFKGCAFYLSPPFLEISEQQLQDLLTLCGAIVVKNESEMENAKSALKLAIVDVADEENSSHNLQSHCTNIVRVAHDWIIECIGMYRRISLPPYIIGQPTNAQITASNIPNDLLVETQDLW